MVKNSFVAEVTFKVNTVIGDAYLISISCKLVLLYSLRIMIKGPQLVHNYQILDDMI